MTPQTRMSTNSPSPQTMAEMSWQVRDVIRQVIEDRLAYINEGGEPQEDLLQQMINVYVQDYPEAMNDVEMLTQELGDNLVEIMFAGYNTAVPTTCHALFFLAMRPDFAQLVTDEVDEVLQGRTPTMADIPKLKHCEAAFMEALRLCPPASLVARQTTRDLVLEGVDFPRGTRVWMPACAIHRDEQSWEDAGSFLPERFLEKKKPKRGTFIPFSDG